MQVSVCLTLSSLIYKDCHSAQLVGKPQTATHVHTLLCNNPDTDLMPVSNLALITKLPHNTCQLHTATLTLTGTHSFDRPNVTVHIW